MSFTARVVVTALALWLTSLLLPTRALLVDNGTVLGTVVSALAVALVFCLVNAIIRPFIKLLSLPLYLLTLGLFSLVVSALMLWITTQVTDAAWFPGGFQVTGGFWTYVGVAILLAILQTVIGGFAPKRSCNTQGSARQLATR